MPRAVSRKRLRRIVDDINARLDVSADAQITSELEALYRSMSRPVRPTVSDMPMSQTSSDLTDWLTKQQAADAIGVSTKAIERFAQAKKLEQRFRPQARGPQVAVYHPDDVARLASERQPAPSAFVLPADPTPPNGNARGAGQLARAIPPAVAAPTDDPLRALAAAICAFMSQTSETSASETLFLTIRQAAGVTGLSQAYLRRLIADGALKAIRDRGWRIRRRDLDLL